MTTYTLETLQASLGLSRTVVGGLIKAGFVTPTRGARREYRFSFQDMVLLRTAHSLQAARIAPRGILRALTRLRAQLPDDLPLTGLRIAVAGDEVTVREGGSEWAVESGQRLMDFRLTAQAGGEVRTLNGSDLEERAFGGRGLPRVADLVELARRHEAAGETAHAESAYRAALLRDASCADAAMNLGVLLSESGRLDDAVQVYLDALAQLPRHAMLHYNLAVALEDVGSPDEALAAYEACLRLQPDLPDAHFNAGRLYEEQGDATRALRHYAAYRRLQRS
ncbi:MAG: tetratricopeptide repeat protein [Burkholderiaceae bacterium]